MRFACYSKQSTHNCDSPVRLLTFLILNMFKNTLCDSFTIIDYMINLVVSSRGILLTINIIIKIFTKIDKKYNFDEEGSNGPTQFSLHCDLYGSMV